MKNQLEINIKKHFTDFTLNIECSMGEGITVLFGHSGSGKTLTLNLCAGLLPPDEGFIRFNHVDFFHAEKKIFLKPFDRHIGYVFQDLALFPHMSVEENLAFALRPNLSRAEKKERISSSLEKFSLGDLAKKKPKHLSGGQKQRVAFARALMAHPQILFLDEPFSSLDYKTREEMYEILLKIKKENPIPIVLVTHDPYEVKRLNDQVILYEQGRVAQQGSLAEILSSPTSPFVQGLMRTYFSQ